MKLKKGLIIFLLIFGSFMLLSMLFISGLSMLLDSKPIVQKNSVLQIVLGGEITEWYSGDVFSREFEGASLQLHDIRKSLKMAAVDSRIEGVYLRIFSPSLGWAKAEEINRLITEFKESGKFVVAHINFCDEKAYYLALAADEIYMPPQGFTALNGLAAQVPFMKNTYAKLGIKPQVDNIGKYKSSGETYKRETMSAPHQEATEAILSDIYNHFLKEVSSGRGLERSTLESLLAKGVFQAGELKNAGLVDDLKNEADVFEQISKQVHGEASDLMAKTINAQDYARISAEDIGLGQGEQIALIYAVGTILPGYSGHDPLNGRTLGAESIARAVRAAANNNDVKAIVLRVDSPGGSAQASDQIWAELQKVKSKKPIVVSMSDLAASGGYWISMDADAIVAEPQTLTGSIGVVMTLLNAAETYDKLGINWEIVKTDRHADVPTEKRPLTQVEWQKFKDFNQVIYKTFVEKVAAGREQTLEEIDRVAQGRTWTGLAAFQHGLVDSLGGLDVALGLAKKEAGIAPEANTQWRVYPKPKDFFQSLFERMQIRTGEYFFSQNESLSLINQIPVDLKNTLQRLAFIRFLRNGEALALAVDLPVIQ